MAVVAGRGVSTGRAQQEVTSGRNEADVSQREDLANFISMITRDETPFMSSIGKTKATSIYHEWQTDSLETPGNSRIHEGTDYVLPGSTAALAGGTTSASNGGEASGAGTGAGKFNVTGPMRTRLGNYTQINAKTIAVSGTRRAIDQAGVADEYAYQLKKRGTELRRDLEFNLIMSHNVSNADGIRSMGGFQAWINDSTGIYPGASTSGTVIANGAAHYDSDGGAAVSSTSASNIGTGVARYSSTVIWSCCFVFVRHRYCYAAHLPGRRKSL